VAAISRASLGIAVALVAYAVYSASDALVKGLGQSLGPFEIGFAIALFSLLPGLLGKPKTERWRDTFRLANPGWVHAIALLRMASNVLAVYAFISVPLADAYCIIFMMPVFIAILSVVVLREQVPLSRWLLVGVSFVGVLLVVRPGFRELQLGHLAALGFSLTAAAALVITRMVAAEEKRMSLFALPLLYTAGFNGLMLLGGFTMPDAMTLLVLVACGLTGGAGYLLQVVALSMAPASRVAPIQYSQILWALLLGVLFFDEVPDALALAGMSIVVMAGLANVVIDGRRARVAGRFGEFRGDKATNAPTGDAGPGPDAV
jgi:drug/metabolite transporter (DMT)-like permease